MGVGLLREDGLKINSPPRRRKHTLLLPFPHQGKNGSKSTTPQGDGNLIKLADLLLLELVQNPLPRKGTETVTRDENQEMYFRLRFKIHYPARGRKREGQTCPTVLVRWFKIHYPARGRKLCKAAFSGEPRCVQNPLPRKGTETGLLLLLFLLVLLLFKIHYPARGRKLLLSSVPFTGT